MYNPHNEVEWKYLNLYEITKASSLGDKVSVPSPMKNELEQLHHKYRVALGQVKAGNDNPKLIRELKLLLLKLREKRLIPSREANEVIYFLTELGV